MRPYGGKCYGFRFGFRFGKFSVLPVFGFSGFAVSGFACIPVPVRFEGSPVRFPVAVWTPHLQKRLRPLQTHRAAMGPRLSEWSLPKIAREAPVDTAVLWRPV